MVEWLVYSWVTTQGEHKVGKCTRKMWTDEWNKPDARESLELAECTMLAEGLTQEEAKQFVALTRED